MSQIVQKVQSTQNSEKKTAGALLLQPGSEITEKEQLLFSIHNDTICHITISHFTNQAQGDNRIWNCSNFTKKLILSNQFNSNAKHCRF